MFNLLTVLGYGRWWEIPIEIRPGPIVERDYIMVMIYPLSDNLIGKAGEN